MFSDLISEIENKLCDATLQWDILSEIWYDLSDAIFDTDENSEGNKLLNFCEEEMKDVCEKIKYLEKMLYTLSM